MFSFFYKLWLSIFRFRHYPFFRQYQITQYSHPLPIEIWTMIIEFAYDPLRYGWHRDLWLIARTSKTHYDAVKYLFIRFCEKSHFPQNSKLYLSIDDYINIMIKNCPIIEPGFFMRVPDFYFSGLTIMSSRKYTFYSKNCYDKKIKFFQQNYFTNRCSISKTCTNQSKNIFFSQHTDTHEDVTLKDPTIIIPYITPQYTRGIFAIVRNEWGDVLYAYEDHTGIKCESHLINNYDNQFKYILALVKK